MSHLFPESDPDDNRTLLEASTGEWDEQWLVRTGCLAAGWRLSRLEYKLQLPTFGWFVDIQHPDSIATITDSKGSLLQSLDVDDDVNEEPAEQQLSESRTVTTAIARWVRGRILFDGSRPHGIVYPSKHRFNGTVPVCWAIWLRHVDEGRSHLCEPTKADDGAEVRRLDQNQPLLTVAKAFNLNIF
ncbi:MAG TPA: hypothetical protein VIU11_06945 [Nakamurella sp.]